MHRSAELSWKRETNFQRATKDKVRTNTFLPIEHFSNGRLPKSGIVMALLHFAQ